MFTVNGSPIAELSATWSWGLAPGSASITVPGAVSISAGDEFSIDLGGLVFSGIVTTDSEIREDGLSTRIAGVDYRLQLLWDVVFCRFNQVEIKEEDPLVPNLDRRKRYTSILPDDWASQTVTTTDAPWSAADIITFLLEAASVTYDWIPATHDVQDDAVLGLDWNRGVKLGNALQEISERQGLLFTITGDNHLVWARKGEGTPPAPPSASSTNLRDGEALSHLDTKITLVGERNRYQDHVSLEPDWNAALQDFWSAPSWWSEVDRVFGPYAADDSGQAELSAKAQSVTLRAYNDHELAVESPDYGLWGEISRMDLPVWIYLRDIVFKSYRVPRDYTFNGIPLGSLALHEGLLAAVDFDPEAGTFGLRDPREYYPEDRACVIALGQGLALLDPRTQRLLTSTQLNNARETWTAANQFRLDMKNKAVVFEHAVFLPGADAEGLFIFPNEGKAGIDAAHPLANITVPNAAVTVAPAAVAAELVFEAEFYSRTVGDGERHGVQTAKDLSLHAIYDNGVFVEEVTYADDRTVEQKADDEAASLILGEEVYAEGGYQRHGACGTPLNGSVDRVTVTVNFAGGLTEDVEYTKERASGSFTAERELDRRQRQKELFPGQAENKAEVKSLRAIALNTRTPDRPSLSYYASVSEVLQKPVGAFQATVQLATLEAATAAGTPLFADGAGGYPSDVFLGILIADASLGPQVALALDGPVPVRIQGPFAAGDPIGVEATTPGSTTAPLENFGRVGTGKIIGRCNADYTGSDIVVAPVTLTPSVETGEEDISPLYVMGTTAYGSSNPDNPTAPPARDHAQTDTWDVTAPPLLLPTAISGHTAASPTVIASTDHGIPPAAVGGKTVTVRISGVTGSSPDINGSWRATFIDSSHFSIPVAVITPGTGGTVSIRTSGVQVNEWTRFYISGSGTFSQKVWTRGEARRGTRYHTVTAETEAENDTESGSGSAGGGLPL